MRNMRVNKLHGPITYLQQKTRTIFLTFSLAFLINSCSHKTFDSQEALLAYIHNVENGYSQKKSINGIVYSLTYRPTDIVVQQMLVNNQSSQDIDSLKLKIDKYLYFNLSISKNNQEILNEFSLNKNDFGSMVKQLAFNMEDKVHLISKKRDTIDLFDYAYPRLYGMGNSTSLLFIYPKKKEIFEDHEFFLTIEDVGLKTGEISFKVPTKLIKEQPKLNFKNIY